MDPSVDTEHVPPRPGVLGKRKRKPHTSASAEASGRIESGPAAGFSSSSGAAPDVVTQSVSQQHAPREVEGEELQNPNRPPEPPLPKTAKKRGRPRKSASDDQKKKENNNNNNNDNGGPTANHPPSPLPPAAAAAAPSKRPAAAHSKTAAIKPVACDIPWPAYLRSLGRTHGALNLVFTFCLTRKQLATTLDTIRTAVESHTRQPLLVHDVAAVAALRPGGVRFEYVDERMLLLDARGAERDDTFTSSRGRGGQALFADASVGGLTGREGLAPLEERDKKCNDDEKGGDGNDGGGGGGGDADPSSPREVLLFEFVDEDLKRQVADRKTGEPTKPTRRLRHEDVRMPVFGQKQMVALIEKRNAKFTNAVHAFLNRCAEAKLDPELALRSEAEAFMPRLASAGPSPSTKDASAAATGGEGSPQLGTTSGSGSNNNSNNNSNNSNNSNNNSNNSNNSNNNTSMIPPAIPKERKSIPEIVSELKASPWYTGQIVPDGHRVFAAQEAVYGDLDFLLSQDLVNALYNARGIARVYSHQAAAINGLHAGWHVVVSTSTSSGKSLIYQLPVLHALEQALETRAMFIFPTKALAQDQKRSLREVLSYMPTLAGEVLVETFDGDTPMVDRARIRDHARVIFTNPDMLHMTILPQEERWRSFLKNLKYVVVDELHYYNGLLGSHMAFIMRRLRRICAAVGNRRVRFISCSATVANPEEHFKTVFGIDKVLLVDQDGSPSGRKEFLCWNTPYKDPADPSSGRGDARYESARLFCQLVLRGVRVIAFCRVREQCEKLVAGVRQELEALGRPECMARVMGYRGGYTAQDRRAVETDMFEGRLLGIVATTALELGVDIGTLDCVLTWGFPYTIANLRQQSGRAGRRNKDSLSILVGDCFPCDQHYMQNPDELFTRPNCALQVDLDNMLVREGHVQCAAHEMPIRPSADAAYLGADLARLCEERLVADDAGFYHCHERFRPAPSRFVAIRDTEDEHFAIVDVTHGRNVVLEELEASRATFTLYDGAIFLHQGTTYLVRDFCPERRIARVERVKVDWTTEQRDYTDVDAVATEAIRRIPGSRSRAYHGAIRITQVVFGYFKMDKRRRVLDAIQVDNRPVVRHSKGMWLDVPRRALQMLAARRLNAAASIHAAEHAVMSLIPNFVASMPGDVRTECKNGLKELRQRRETTRKRPARLTIYDARGGAQGSGLSTKAFEFADALLAQALARVEACACARGCPECVCSDMCKEANEVTSKAGARLVLATLLGREVDVDSLPMGPEGEVPVTVETVVLARPVMPRDASAVRLVGLERGEIGQEDEEEGQEGHTMRHTVPITK